MPRTFAQTTKNLKHWVTANVTLNYKAAGKASLRETHASIERQIANPDMPESMRRKLQSDIEAYREPVVNRYEDWLLKRFWELDSARAWTADGPNTIPFTEINSYAETVGEEFEPIELQILKAVDSAYVSAYFTEQNKAHSTT